MNDLTIDLTYINRLSTRIDGFSIVRKNLWVARCPVCGDSKKSKSKRRWYVYLNEDHYSVKCHNCSYSQPFSKFLEEYFPEEYKAYILDKLPQRSTLKKDRFKHVKELIPEKVICNGFDYSSLKKFDELSSDHPARIYTENRKIPLHMVYYCPNFGDFIQEIGITKYILSYERSKEPRMIIPFYRSDLISTVFQARAFSTKEYLRYITIKEHESEPKIYGADRINEDKLVYCVEGPLDSLMIPNAIAMSGISTKIPTSIKDICFVFDNEPRNIDVGKSMKKKLKAGYKVVIFPPRMKYKDLNDMVVKGGMSRDEVLKLINDNIYTKDKGIMKLKEWEKG